MKDKKYHIKHDNFSPSFPTETSGRLEAGGPNPPF